MDSFQLDPASNFCFLIRQQGEVLVRFYPCREAFWLFEWENTEGGNRTSCAVSSPKLLFLITHFHGRLSEQFLFAPHVKVDRSKKIVDWPSHFLTARACYVINGVDKMCVRQNLLRKNPAAISRTGTQHFLAGLSLIDCKRRIKGRGTHVSTRFGHQFSLVARTGIIQSIKEKN